MLNKYLERLERRFRRFAIRDLMRYIIIGMAIVYLFDIVTAMNPNNNLSLISLLSFNKGLIMQGQVWRVISFMLIPVDTTLVLAVFVLYLYWIIGESLERQWGSFRFNIYYFIGAIGCIAVGLITGYSTNFYLNMSLFIAYAILFPNEELLLFFFIPIKVKWLGLLDGAFLVYMFIVGGLYTRIILLVSFANLIMFFGKDFVDLIYYTCRRYYYKWFRNKF